MRFSDLLHWTVIIRAVLKLGFCKKVLLRSFVNEPTTYQNDYNFVYWIILCAFLSSADFLKKNQIFRIPSVPNSLDPDKVQHFIEPDLDLGLAHQRQNANQ